MLRDRRIKWRGVEQNGEDVREDGEEWKKMVRGGGDGEMWQMMVRLGQDGKSLKKMVRDGK